MKQIMVALLVFALLFSGCKPYDSNYQTTVTTAPPEVIETTIPILTDEIDAAVELETMDQETGFLLPYINESRSDGRGNPSFHCLIRNELFHSITLTSISTVYTIKGDVVTSNHYTDREMSPFFRRYGASAELDPMEANLLIIDDVPDAAFDHVTVTVFLIDSQGEMTDRVFQFSMDPSETCIADMGNYSGDISYTRDDGWSWVHEVTNDTDSALTLDSVHYVEYQDGIPLYVGNDSVSAYIGYHIEDIAFLEPGESGIFTNSISYQFLDFNQRETIFVYRDEKGNPLYKTFFFNFEQALTQAEYLGMPSDLKILIGEQSLDVLGGRILSDYEIRKLADSDAPLDEISERISTLADCLKFLSYKGFSYDEVPMKMEYHQGFAWNYLDDLEVIFGRNYGACGCGSTLINYILTGDYDQQGYVMEVNAIDRHIYNWILADGVYYFVDWVSQELTYGNSSGYNVYAVRDPQVYSAYKIKMSKENPEGNEIYLQYLYTRDGSVMPIGIQRQILPYARILPSDTRDNVMLLYEDSEMCTLEFRDGPPLS